MKKKKYFENLIAKHDELLDTLEKLVDDISFAQIEVQVVEGLEQGNKALKELNKILSIERVESILEETREGIEKQRVSCYDYKIISFLLLILLNLSLRKLIN